MDGRDAGAGVPGNAVGGGLEAFERDFNSGRIVRTHLLWCTWQLISWEDYAWMRPLCAPKALFALKGWMTSNKISISSEEE